MAGSIRTVFQNLEKTLGGGWGDGKSRNVSSYDFSNAKNTVIYKTNDKEDYEKKKLELRQQNYLNNIWRTSNRNLNNNSINGLNAVKMMYRDVEIMSCYPEIGAALDLYANESTCNDSKGNIINVYSDSTRIKSIIEDLLVNRLDIQMTAPMIIRALCKYGNQFMLLNIKANQGICGWRQLPPAEIERVEDGILIPYAAGYTNQNNENEGTTFVWMGNQTGNQVFRNWQIAHFRLLEDSIFLPYGCSILHKARRHFRILSLMEDSLLLYRLERSVERRVYKIYVGAIDDADVQGYVEDIANSIKRTPIVDPQTGQLDLRKNILPVHKDTPIPLLDGRIITIEQLSNEFNEGKTNYVYSIQDNSLQIVPGKVVWCGKNYTADKLLKITLDDGTYTIMAPEHELIMRDGTKKRADEVSSGESVMPFYTKKDSLSEETKNDYELVYNPRVGDYQFTHRLVGLELPRESKANNTIHHKNICELNNRFNNSPENLVWMTFKDHRKLHNTFNTEHQKLVAQETMKDIWKDEKWKANAVSKMAVNFDEHIWNEIEKAIVNEKVYNRITLLDFINNNLIDYLIEINNSNKLRNNRSISRVTVQIQLKKIGYNTITEYLDDVAKKNNSKLPSEIVAEIGRKKAYESGFNKYGALSDEEKATMFSGKKRIPNKNFDTSDTLKFDDFIWDSIRKAILNKTVDTIPSLLKYINTELIDYILKLTKNTKIHQNKKVSETGLYRIIKKEYNMSTGEFIMSMKKNHKISKIEWVDGDDVYCMTIEGLNGEQDRHNFAICSWNEDKSCNRSGIFVSNCASDDIFIPTRNEDSPTPIDTLPAGQNLTAIDDIKYIQNKVLAGLGIPKSFLNFEETTGDGKNLALMDVRFARVITRIQQAFLMELTKVVTIHLYLLGFKDDLTNFTLTMNNPSTQAEQLEIENLAKKIAAVRDAVSDPGNGIPVMSMTRAWKEIMKYNDAEIKDMLEEIRLEKALAAELEKTSQIIKRTNIFDTVDKIYGEPGAEYQEDNAVGMPGADGGLAGGGGGASIGGGFGDGLDNLGDPGNTDNSGDISGEEGSTDANNIPGETNNSNQTNPQESKLKKNKPLITENNLFNSIYFNKMMDKINHKKDLNENAYKRVEPSNESNLLINEEYDSMIDELNKIIDKHQNNNNE